tara:strand:+ start:1766 stop:2563 length:798 start_codon:yes stop_codon:yes gene_type:complete
MNRIDFSNLLALPSKLKQEETSAVYSIIKEYPYFQAARALYLKGLKNEGSFKYNKTLKTTAAYTSDRSILFNFITSEAFSQNTASEQIKHNHEGLKTIKVTAFEDISNRQISKIAAIEVENKNDAHKTTLKIGAPLEFKKGETYPFSKWLQLTNLSPIDRSNDFSKKIIKKHQTKQKLIDDFIEKSPKIKPVKKLEPIKNLAEKPIIDSDLLMTETLARIYLEQKNYEKALQSYKILSLKYPEKSSLFADQINAIKKLQEKNKIS